MPKVLRAIYGPGPGEVDVPQALIVFLYCLAAWGGLMFLIGWLRVIQSALSRHATLAAAAVLPVMAIGHLWVLMVLFAR